MSGKSLGFETWHFQFTLAFVLRPFLSAYSDVKGIKGEIIFRWPKLAQKTRF